MTHECILIVEEDDSVRATLAANIAAEGFDVLEAEHGLHALDLIAREHVDLVLSDVRLPVMDGIELFDRIKNIWPELPTMLMTPSTNGSELKDGATDDTISIVSKPFDLEIGMHVLRRALGRPLVLIVDEAQGAAVKIAAVLQESGLRARASLDGDEATRLVSTSDVDVCVVDVTIPDGNGFELVEAIRTLDPTIAVVAFSGHEISQLVQQATSARAYPCVDESQEPSNRLRANRLRANRLGSDRLRAMALAGGEGPSRNHD